MSKYKYYAVAQGHKPGIYTTWYGADGAEVRVQGFPKALYRGFKTREEAEDWYKSNRDNPLPPQQAKAKRRSAMANGAPALQKSKRGKNRVVAKSEKADGSSKNRKLIIYADGGCLNNPGAGGYGTVLLKGGKRRELSGGYRLTTNNRMELKACIAALSSLKLKDSVVLYSDSKYVVNGINKDWARRWKANGWMRNKTDSAENADLWSELLELCDRHSATFKWVKGHAGNPENERCDELATEAALQKGLPPDENYENGKTKLAQGSRIS